MKADIMLYPPHSFRETYGIAFLEAQAAGVLIFYRQNGALGETIGDRGVPLVMDMTPEQIVQKLAEVTSGDCDIIRSKAREYALSRSWGKQTEKFLKLYKDLEKEK